MGTVDEQSLVQLLNVVDSRGSRDEAVFRLKRMLPRLDLANGANEAIKTKLYRILPALLAYLLLRDEKLGTLNLINRILVHEGDESYRNLLRRWICYIENTNENDLSPVTENFSNLLAYDKIDFFIRLCRFLKIQKKLHKYIYFFGNLTYIEFRSLNAEQLTIYEEKIGLLPITNGARGAILSMAEELKLRVTMIREYIRGSIENFETAYRYVSYVLKTPIKKEEEITDLLVACLRRMSIVANGSDEKKKALELLDQALSTSSVFNKHQIRQLTNVRETFRNPSSSNSYNERPQKEKCISMEPQPANEIPKIFEEAEIQAGFERTVTFLLKLMDDID